MRVVAALCAVLLPACALLQPDAGEALQVRDIVSAAVSSARATQEDQRRQLAQAQQLYAAVPDDANRLRLAALLATLPVPLRDDARVVLLIEPLAARRPESPLAQLAGMLASSVAERQKLARDLRAAERRGEAAEERATLLRQQVDAAEERAATLRQQVEAFKSIERGILEREERRRNTKR